ncbi:MAG: DUF4296 domain-containing protein [Bacteroidia bacterium]
MYRYFIAIIVLSFFACEDKNYQKPDGLIPEDTMVEIMKDLQILEAVHKDVSLFGVDRKAMSDTSYVIVFNKYGVKASEFDSTYSYYSKHPEDFEALMLKVEESLNYDQ